MQYGLPLVFLLTFSIMAEFKFFALFLVFNELQTLPHALFNVQLITGALSVAIQVIVILHITATELIVEKFLALFFGCNPV